LLIADFGLWIAPQVVTVRSGTPTNAESSTGNGIRQRFAAQPFDVRAEMCYAPANVTRGAMSKDMQQHCSKQVKRAKKPDVWSG